MSDKIELNRRRVLGGLVTIGAAGAAVGAGTFALFSDTEQSTGNTVQAGTLDLGSVSGSISVTDLVPGEAISATTFESDYTGSVEARIDLDVTLDEPSGEPSEPASNDNDLNATEFAERLEVTTATATVGGSEEDLLTSEEINDDDDDGTITLDELVSSAPFEGVTGSNATNNDTVSFELNLDFPSGVGNEAQADGVDITVEFYAEQA